MIFVIVCELLKSLKETPAIVLTCFSENNFDGLKPNEFFRSLHISRISALSSNRGDASRWSNEKGLLVVAPKYTRINMYYTVDLS